ncbi:MAG: FtsX-like permease family protein [Nitrospinota bacterium]
MQLLKIAFKNLKRRKVRTILTIAGVGVASAVFVSLLGFQRGYKEALFRDVDKMGYQVLITAKGCPYEAATLMLKGGAGLRYMEEAVYNQVVSDPRIDKITSQLIQVVYDLDRNEGRGGYVMILGVERSMLELKPWMRFKSGGWFSSDISREVIMGYEVAELEQRLSGDKLFIPGIEGDFTVAGILERTGTHDDGTIFMPLHTVQSLFKLEKKLTGVGIKLKDISMIPEFEESLYNVPAIQVISMAQVKGTILGLIQSAQVMVTAVAVIAVIVAVFGVINTLLMSVMERTHEFGMFKSVGASGKQIFLLILYETMLICIVATMSGNIVVWLGAKGVENIVRMALPYAPYGELVVITPEIMIISLFGAIFVGILSGIYPAIRASRLSPVEAIRREE